MTTSLDTNILMRYIWKDVPGQREKAVALLDDESQTFYISDLVVAEVAFNLRAENLRRKTVAKVLESILAKRNIKANPMIMDEVLPFFAEHPALSFVDCYAACEAGKRGREPLWTFDRRLANQHPSAKRLN